jgi:hypothetical protein
MFAAELKNAHRSRDKQTICRLIESIPADRWIYLDGAEAVASYDGARIAAQSCGGSGIHIRQNFPQRLVAGSDDRFLGRVHGGRDAIAELHTSFSAAYANCQLNRCWRSEAL